MTKEDEKATIAALLEERRGYEQRVAMAEEADDAEALAAAKDRVAQVDVQLRVLGHRAKKPSQQAVSRPSQAAAAKR